MRRLLPPPLDRFFTSTSSRSMRWEHDGAGLQWPQYNMSEAAMLLSCEHCLDCCVCCYSCYQKALYYMWCDTSLPPTFKHTRESDQGSLHTAGANSRRANVQQGDFSVPLLDYFRLFLHFLFLTLFFLLSNQSSALPPASHYSIVVALYSHELTRSWLRRAVLTHKANGFYVCHTLWWGVRLYLCVTVSSEL